MARALAKKVETSTTLLEAAKKVLRQNGYAGLSTRDVARRRRRAARARSTTTSAPSRG